MRYALTVLVTIAFVRATGADAAKADEPRTMEEQRAREIRALLDRALYDSEMQSRELLVDPSLSSIDWQLNLAAFQDEESVSADPTDFDGGGAPDEGDLASAAQNPIADLISLPFQNNTNIDTGQLNYEQNVLNIQPVIPLHLNDDWNLITRTIIPVIYQPSLFSGDDHDFGLGDIQFSGFFSPTKTFGGWMLGGGPVMRLATATDERLGARKWAFGPTAVAILIEGPWVIGGLCQNVWSVAGSGDQNVNEFLVQPFVNYNIPDSGGWYLTTSPIITANWQADDSDDRWTVPVGGGVGRVFRIGDQPVNVSLQGFYNVEKPDALGDWTIRFQFQLLFPR